MTPALPRGRNFAFLLPLVAVAALVIAARSRALPLPLERDEGEYAYAGQLILDGFAPFRLAYSVKLPGTSAVYAAIMAIFGESPAGIHFGFLLINVAALIFLTLIALRVVGEKGAVVAGVSFALLSSSAGVLGLQGHATQLVAFFALAGIWAWFKARETKRQLWLLGSGLLFGLSFLCKQPGLFFGLFGGAMITIDALRQRSNLFAQLALYLTGLAAPYLITCFLVWRSGTFETFWFWTVRYASMHAGLLTPATVLSHFLSFFQEIGIVNAALPLAAVGLVCLFTSRHRGESRIFLLMLLAFSWLAFCVSLYFMRHYFIMMVPVVSLLTAVAYNSLDAATPTPRWVSPACAAIAFAAYIVFNANIWFALPLDAVSRELYGNNPFLEAPAIGQLIQQSTPPDARVAVFGSEPEILFYAHRRSATGFIYMYDLVWRQKHAHDMQMQMIREIEDAKPEFVVMVNVMPSWMFWHDSDTTIVSWGNDYVRRFYDDAGAVYIYPDHSEFATNAAAMKKNPDTPDLVLLYRRKPNT